MSISLQPTYVILMLIVFDIVRSADIAISAGVAGKILRPIVYGLLSIFLLIAVIVLLGVHTG